MPYQFTPSQQKAIAQMKAQGFTHAKIELEAQLGRGDSYDSCPDCSEGYNDCSSCDGSGVVEATEIAPNGNTLSLTGVCTNCSGDGTILCLTCNGDYENANGDYGDESECEVYLLRHVSEAARNALVYSQFYNDGSVDSEFTYTVALDDLPLAVEFIDAFSALGDEIGNEFDVSGAGMHLTVLTGPVYPSNQGLDPDKIANFKTEVTKLLPALYFLASPDHQSRGLDFRHNLISTSKYSDYPAICTHDDTALEYRIFETCYQKPEALLENFEVIARTLKYYSARKIKLPSPSLRNERNFDQPGSGVGRFYRTPEKLKALNSGLPYLKPGGKTIAKLKLERNFKLTLKELHLKERVAKARYKDQYDEYLKKFEEDRANWPQRVREDHERLVRDYSMYPPENVCAYLNSRGRQLYEVTTPELQLAFANEWYTPGEPLSFDQWLARNVGELAYA